MRAAIYARYSSDNQRPESIDDQIRACQELAAARDYIIDPGHIYKDEAKSGALRDRPGLEALCAAVRDGQFQAVIVDDLSRLSRDNHFLLTIYAELRFHEVRIISRADSLDTGDDRAKLGFQMRGIINELYLDDLRERTLRGQKGQKARGFTVGEGTYGYRSEPVDEMRLDRRGRPRPEGYRMVIDPSEAQVVQRIFREFAGGRALTAIVKALNSEGIRGRRRIRHGWSPATVSRILKNEKYVGRWTWNRTEVRRDPRTGRKRKVAKPRNEWHTVDDDRLRIIPPDDWACVIARWKEVGRTWPTGRGQRGFRGRKGAMSRPTRLTSSPVLSGAARVAAWSGRSVARPGATTAV